MIVLHYDISLGSFTDITAYPKINLPTIMIQKVLRNPPRANNDCPTQIRAQKMKVPILIPKYLSRRYPPNTGIMTLGHVYTK